MTLKNFVYMR